MDYMAVIDKVLQELDKSTEETPIPKETIFYNIGLLESTSPRFRESLIIKLQKEGLVEYKNNLCNITLEGELLLQQKGYKERYKREHSKSRRNETLAISIAISSAIAAAYYLVEIAKETYHFFLHD